MNIILASSSPRRKELLSLITSDFTCLESNTLEVLNKSLPLEEQVSNLAYEKALNVFNKTSGNRIVIGGDTIVTKDGVIYGKPINESHAKEMIKDLLKGDRTHKVITGLAVLIENNGEYKEYITYDTTKLYLKNISDKEIDKWIATGHALDKAGAYAIQQEFSVFIDKIEGNYSATVGLPVHKLYDIIKDYLN